MLHGAGSILVSGIIQLLVPGSAVPAERGYVEDTQGRYRLEVSVPWRWTRVGLTLPIRSCLSTAHEEAVEICIGVEPVQPIWAGRNGHTTVILLPGEAFECHCARIVTLTPGSPVCWRSYLVVPDIANGTLDLGGLAMVLEGAVEDDLKPPRCVEVRSNVERLVVEPADPEPPAFREAPRETSNGLP